MAEVEAVSQQYMPLANSCSSIYFTLESLNQVLIDMTFVIAFKIYCKKWLPDMYIVCRVTVGFQVQMKLIANNTISFWMYKICLFFCRLDPCLQQFCLVCMWRLELSNQLKLPQGCQAEKYVYQVFKLVAAVDKHAKFQRRMYGNYHSRSWEIIVKSYPTCTYLYVRFFHRFTSCTSMLYSSS